MPERENKMENKLSKMQEMLLSPAIAGDDKILTRDEIHERDKKTLTELKTTTGAAQFKLASEHRQFTDAVSVIRQVCKLKAEDNITLEHIKTTESGIMLEGKNYNEAVERLAKATEGKLSRELTPLEKRTLRDITREKFEGIDTDKDGKISIGEKFNYDQDLNNFSFPISPAEINNRVKQELRKA